jgi:hypothetical protein
MNKKMVIGTLLGAILLFAAIATITSATPGLTATMDDETVETGASMSNGDCDRTGNQLRSQDRDMLRNGSCGECTGLGSDGAGNGPCATNQTMLGWQKHLRSMFGEAFGEYAFKYMFQGAFL